MCWLLCYGTDLRQTKPVTIATATATTIRTIQSASKYESIERHGRLTRQDDDRPGHEQELPTHTFTHTHTHTATRGASQTQEQGEEGDVGAYYHDYYNYCCYRFYCYYYYYY